MELNSNIYIYIHIIYTSFIYQWVGVYSPSLNGLFRDLRNASKEGRAVAFGAKKGTVFCVVFGRKKMETWQTNKKHASYSYISHPKN